MEGFIAIHRKILDWEWYSNPNVKILFLHCLLKANFAEKKWQGETIKRGEFVTSIATLAGELGMTFQQVRTALDKLKSTNEITSRTTNKFTIVTISNYDKYQVKEKGKQQTKQQRKQQTNNKQTTNEQQTNNNNLINNNNDNNEDNNIPPLDIPPQTDLFGEIPAKKQKGTKEGSCLFENSRFHDFTIFEKEFDKPEFAGVDLYYYYQAISDWSASGGKKKHDWIATARNWMRSDMSKNQLHRIKSNEVDPDMIEYLHSMQQ